MERWIELDGAANARDLGGLPAGPGQRIRRDRLLRSDNLQGLTPSDVRTLIDEHRLRAVADLRTDQEVATEGPGPLLSEPSVSVHHLSLFPESGETTDVAAPDDGGPALLPWQDKQAERNQVTVREVYLRYLRERPDSILAALRLIASTAAADGATIVHCAAGKDRTGVVVAFALAEVGVDHETIVEDYLATGDRIIGILTRLAASSTYARDTDVEQADRHRPRRETFEGFLADLDTLGGASRWLRDHGWTDEDANRLRAALLEPREEAA